MLGQFPQLDIIRKLTDEHLSSGAALFHVKMRCLLSALNNVRLLGGSKGSYNEKDGNIISVNNNINFFCMIEPCSDTVCQDVRMYTLRLSYTLTTISTLNGQLRHAHDHCMHYWNLYVFQMYIP